MLHDNSQKIKLLKLVSGEEIVGEFRSTSGENGNYVPMIRHPLMLILIKNPKNETSADVSFVPWMMGIDFLSTELALSPASIMTVTEPNVNLLSKYIGAVSQFKNAMNAKAKENVEEVKNDSE